MATLGGAKGWGGGGGGGGGAAMWPHWEEQKVGVGLPRLLHGHIGRSNGAATPSTWPHWEEQKVGVGLTRLLHGGAKGGGGAAMPSTWPHWEEQWGCHAFYMATLGGAKGGAATPSTWPHWEEQKVGLPCLVHAWPARGGGGAVHGHIGRSKRWWWG